MNNILLLFLLVVNYAVHPASSFPIFGKKEKYFIQLKRPNSVETLCAHDDKARYFSHLRGDIRKVFSFGEFEGFVGEFTKDVIERISSDPLVEYITKDICISASELPTINQQESVGMFQESPSKPFRQEKATKTDYSNFQGENVMVYIIDTGVYTSNPDFEGRAILGPNFSTDNRNVDYIGHGTHVAGIVGSKTFGVAKKAGIMSIKVLDRNGEGSLSSVIAGLEFAVNHAAKKTIKGIANLSLGSTKSKILDSAVREAFNTGMLVIAAAGNNNLDACKVSPAGSAYALTVGAIDSKTGLIAPFSNWGRCVDVFATGVEIESLGNNFQNPYRTQILSGTSMASPHVAGVAAIMLERGVPMKGILAELKNVGIQNAIPETSIQLREGSPNLIISIDKKNSVVT